MSVTTVLKSSLLAAQGDDVVLTGRDIARFVFLMRGWKEQAVTLQASTLAQTKNNVKKWLNDFDTMFVKEMQRIDALGGYGGWVQARSAAEKANLIDGDDLYSKTVYLNEYKAQMSVLANVEFTRASFLRNNVAKAWQGNVDEFYNQWDLFIKESKGLGLTLREQANVFLDGPIGKNFVGMRDSAGKLWKPESYAVMYSRTRASELEDEIHTDELLNLGVDVVQISSHGTTTPVCIQYEGKTFSLTGATPEFPQLQVRPPFHPGCKHRIIAKTRPDVEKEKKQNIAIDKRAANLRKNAFTTGQLKSIRKQEAWNIKNRRPIV